jgi:predicted DNA-binding protein
MDVQLTPDLQAKMDRLVQETGRTQGEFVLDAVAGYLGELEQLRGMLDRRYDEIKNGSVSLLDGEAAFARIRAKSAVRRTSNP